MLSVSEAYGYPILYSVIIKLISFFFIIEAISLEHCVQINTKNICYICNYFVVLQVSKLQGGGYQVAVIYFKVGNRNTTKGMLPGSGLSSKNVNNLTELFYLGNYYYYYFA